MYPSFNFSKIILSYCYGTFVTNKDSTIVHIINETSDIIQILPVFQCLCSVLGSSPGY